MEIKGRTAMTQPSNDQPTYEIRRGRETVCVSSLEKCGYKPEVLRGILSSGYGYYVNGKRAKG